GVDLGAAGGGVGVQQLLTGAEAADGERRTEAPAPHAQPAEVLGGIALVDELPVEDRPQAVGPDDEVAQPEVAVADRPAHGRGPSAEPTRAGTRRPAAAAARMGAASRPIEPGRPGRPGGSRRRTRA